MKNLDEVGGWLTGYREGFDDAMKVIREVSEKLSKDTGGYLKDRLKEMGLDDKD